MKEAWAGCFVRTLMSSRRIYTFDGRPPLCVSPDLQMQVHKSFNVLDSTRGFKMHGQSMGAAATGC
jgi:hypothetical protein